MKKQIIIDYEEYLQMQKIVDLVESGFVCVTNTNGKYYLLKCDMDKNPVDIESKLFRDINIFSNYLSESNRTLKGYNTRLKKQLDSFSSMTLFDFFNWKRNELQAQKDAAGNK
jgi:hypothetical protein